jgi:hypothetical protein
MSLMEEYRQRLSNMSVAINGVLPKIDRNNAKDLLENSAQLFLSIGFVSNALTVYETKKDEFKGDIVASFTEFDALFEELMDLCEDFLGKANKLK